MSKPLKQTSQAGFTLVELAIVMIIIGLLIAGVLKGQELIGNARVTTTVAQIKAIDAAVSTFKDTYAALPGDMLTPGTRLPNCTAAPCVTPGNGDGKLPTFAAAAAGEQLGFFPHLAAADLITGIKPGTVTFGGDLEAAKIDGAGFVPGTMTVVADLAGALGTNGTPSGLYLGISGSPTTTVAATAGLSPSQASRIDLKLDDGDPSAGSVVGLTAGAAACGVAGAAGAPGTYTTSTAQTVCSQYVRIQG
jgi:prepilin-type N-terminal cleavage/methylation domain-containing protein